MSIRVCIQTLFTLLVVALLFVPTGAHAQEESGFTPKDFALDAVENAAKAVVIGDVPSDDMNILTKDIYAKFLAENLSTDKSLSTCKRVANAQAETGLENLNQKWWQGGWFNLGYKAIKYSVVIASGAAAAGLNDVIAEEGRGVVTSTIEANIRAEDDEVVEIAPYNRCNATVRAVWDKKNMQIRVTIEGNCNCKDIKPRWTDISHDTLKEFKVSITADVEVKSFEVEEENPLMFWRDRRVKVFLGAKNMQVDTKANCKCGVDDSPPPWVSEDGSIVDEDSVDDEIDESEEDPDDKADPPEGEVKEETPDPEKDDGTINGIPAFINWLFGRDKDEEEQPEDQVEVGEDSTERDEKEGEPLMCGARVAVDGRAHVATFPYRPDANGDVNFSCNGTCGPDQVCKVLPKSVGAFRDSCVYCADKPKEVKKDGVPQPPTDKPPVSGGRDCEAAVRLLLDEYMGWFDPPLTVTAGTATMFHEHRCFPEEDFDTHTRQLAIQGVTDAKIKAMCPSLKHKESFMTHITAGAKGLCSSTTVFTY